MLKHSLRHICQLIIAALLILTLAPISQAEELSVAKSEPGMYSVELSRGHESYQSPLVQISDNGALVRLDGISQLSGDISRLSVSGGHNYRLSSSTMLLLSSNMQDSRSANAPDLDFRTLSFDSVISMQAMGGSLGFGPGMQWISVSGQLFRQRNALHVDWTVAEIDQGFSSYMLEYGVNKHAEQFRDFNGISTLGVYHRQFAKPIQGITEASIEIGASREHNTQQAPSMSNTLYYSRLTMDWEALFLNWSVSWTHQRSRFDAPLLVGMRARRDLFNSLDFSAIHALRPQTSLRLDLSYFHNKANSALYESRYRGTMINLVQQF